MGGGDDEIIGGGDEQAVADRGSHYDEFLIEDAKAKEDAAAVVDKQAAPDAEGAGAIAAGAGATSIPPPKPLSSLQAKVLDLLCRNIAA